MLGRRACARAILALALAAVSCAIAGCTGGSAGTGLQAALARVADTASTRSQIWYDDTAEIVSLAGRKLGSPRGFGRLAGLGASSITSFAEVLPHDTGINLLREDFAITAGMPPAALTLIAGGQHSALVASKLSRLGWKRRGGGLVGPPPLDASPAASQYALAMARVLPSGADVRFGETRADLGKIGSPAGPTLAGNPRVSALAHCLGDVVAAGIFVGGSLGGRGPAAVAVGVSRPASATTTPHAVTCAAWQSQAAAARYAADLRRALASGISPVADERYSDLLRHAKVTSTGGSQHIVQWQADTPDNADLVFQMAEQIDLPALPDCARVQPPARAHLFGCP